MMRREYVASATLADRGPHSFSNLTAGRVLALCAMAITAAAFPSVMNAQDAIPARVSGSQIRVVDLSINASPDELQQAKEAYRQGHIIRVAGGSPADLRRLIGAGTYEAGDKNTGQARNARRSSERVALVSAVRLGEHGDVHQFSSEIDANAKEPPKRQWERDVSNWQLKETNAALGDTPGPPAQAWTQVLSNTQVLSGDWGSAQYVLQVFRLNGTDTSADYYMVLTDP
jgi:hypothetical protein